MGGITIYLIEHATNEDINTVGDGVVDAGHAHYRRWRRLARRASRSLGRHHHGRGHVHPRPLRRHRRQHPARVVLTIREEQFRMVSFANHVVIFGYESGTRLMLDVLVEELGELPADVVLMGQGERPSELPPHFRWIDGEPTRESELHRHS